jgi:hypothetical protein
MLAGGFRHGCHQGNSQPVIPNLCQAACRLLILVKAFYLFYYCDYTTVKEKCKITALDHSTFPG